MTNDERKTYQARRDAVLLEVEELLTRPNGAVSGAAGHFAIVSSALGIDRKLAELLEACTPHTRGGKRGREAKEEILVSVLSAAIRLLAELEPVKLV